MKRMNFNVERSTGEISQMKPGPNSEYADASLRNSLLQSVSQDRVQADHRKDNQFRKTKASQNQLAKMTFIRKQAALFGSKDKRKSSQQSNNIGNSSIITQNKSMSNFNNSTKLTRRPSVRHNNSIFGSNNSVIEIRQTNSSTNNYINFAT